MRAHPRFLNKRSISRTSVLFFILMALLTFSHTSPRGVSGSSSAYAVTIIDYAFQPLHINITTGTTVTWTYSSGNTVHTVTSDPQTNETQSGTPLISSGDLSPGQSFSFTFNLPGYYPYQCAVHPTIPAMNGWVRVTGNPVNNPAPSNNSSFPWLLVAGLVVVAVGVVVAAWIVIGRRHSMKREKAPAPSC